MAASYWIGNDGNAYLKGPDGVVQYTNISGASDAGFQGMNAGGGGQSVQATRIANPSGPAPVNQLSPTDTSGDGTKFTDTSAARGVTQTSLNSVDSILNNKLLGADQAYNTVIQGYDTQDATNKKRYEESVGDNENNRESQRQAALLGAAQGSRGLYSALTSIGALGGTGRTLANRAVANEANMDIGESDKTFGANAKSLNNVYGDLEQQEKQRRLDASANLESTKQGHRYDATTTRQQLLKDMAGLWTSAGNNAEAANSLASASALAPELISSTRPSVAPYAPPNLNFSKPAMDSYLGGANDMSVKVAPTSSGAPINGAIFSSTKKRDELV